MAVKSILDIDIGDAKFGRFKETFDKFYNQLGKIPAMQKLSAKGQDAVAKQFERTATAMMKMADLQHKGEDGEKRRTANTRTNETLWTSMARSSGVFAKNVAGATEYLLKWAGVVGGLAGLLATGGLWGIDRMASGVSAGRKGAAGVGMSYGEKKGFDIAFSPLMDTNSYLSWVNSMETDQTKQMSAYGLLGRDINSKGTADNAIDLMEAIRNKAKTTELGMLGPQLRDAFGFDPGPETLRMFKEKSDPEFSGMEKRFRGDRKSLNLSSGTTLAWQNFTQTMDEAKEKINNVFVVGLVALAGPIERLSTAFIHLLSTVMTSPAGKAAVGGVATWMNELADEIGSPAFLDKIRGFTSDMSELTDIIHHMVHPFDTIASGFGNAVNAVQSKFAHDDPAHGQEIRSYNALINQVEKKAGIPAGLLESIWSAKANQMMESSNNSPRLPGVAHTTMSRNDALVQARLLGGGPDDAARMKALLDHYKGSVTEALAGFYSSQGAVDAGIAQYKDQWRYHLDPGVRNQVNQGLKEYNIYVHDATGGQVAITATGLAAGAQ
jgi:hypothetical protein